MERSWAYDVMTDLQLIRAIEKWNRLADRHSVFTDVRPRCIYHNWIAQACAELASRAAQGRLDV